MHSLSTKNASRSYEGCDDVRLHNARNLTVLDQFQKGYLFPLITSFGNMVKRPEGQLRNLNFASNHAHVWLIRSTWKNEALDECKIRVKRTII